MMRVARIDLDALRGNYAILRDLVAPAQLIPVVKAEAYGHGAALVARELEQLGVALLGVADIDEALALRAAGITTGIVAWLHGPDADFAAAIAAGVELVLSSDAQLSRVAELGGAVVHLKIDTGLSRNGCPPEEWDALVARAAQLQHLGVVRVRGIMSHLSNTSPTDDADQFARFDAAVQTARAAGLNPELVHVAASHAAIATPASRHTAVRVGIALYGLAPDATVDAAALGLRPVMSLEGAVVAVRDVPAGAGVSYGFIHRFAAPTRVALVPLGYADGIPRSVSGRGAGVWIAGARRPIVGRIAMDQFVVDIGDSPVRVGDRVVLWGSEAGAPTADEWADCAGTINYEIVTRIGPRVPRLPA